jgi:hypothetical protein
MAFIDKKDPVVINIKLTSKGRELLSKGGLNFTYFGVGDSEINYNFNDEIGVNPYNSLILRPTDKNPQILSFITKELSGDSYNELSTIPSTPTIIQNTSDPTGFFNISSINTSFLTDSDHVKQTDCMVRINTVKGGNNLYIFKSPTYGGNLNEPEVGDFILIKWTNPYGYNTTGYTVSSASTPYLTYKIQTIVSGKLSTNNLIVGLDRDIPDFTNVPNINFNTKVAGAVLLYDYINYSGTTSFYEEYSTDYVSESVLTFLQNCQCPTITFPFWNMSIIYTEEIVGVQSNNIKIGNFNTTVMGGFVSYIQNQAPVYKKLGVIHYTNNSPSNNYGEGLYQNTSILNIPTIMWHKSPNKTMGVTLNATGGVKTLTGITRSLNTQYYDLADSSGNVVGKIFNDLKIFVIEDQELLFAMSYKSNRSWTLPNYLVGSDSISALGTIPCTVLYDYVLTNPTSLSSANGKIKIDNIQTTGTKLIAEVSGVTSGLVYVNLIDILSGVTITGLSADTYNIILHDLNAVGCLPTTVILETPSSILKAYSITGTSCGLNPDFTITNAISSVDCITSNHGVAYGTMFMQIQPYGVAPISGDWFENSSTENFTDLVFKNVYTIYIMDHVNTTTEFMVSKDYVAVKTPFKSTFIISNQIVDDEGIYVTVSNYLTTINAGLNPIVGIIEFCIYKTDSIPIKWQTLPSGNTVGDNINLYVEDEFESYTVAIREVYYNEDRIIEMYRITKAIENNQYTLTTI